MMDPPGDAYATCALLRKPILNSTPVSSGKNVHLISGFPVSAAHFNTAKREQSEAQPFAATLHAPFLMATLLKPLDNWDRDICLFDAPSPSNRVPALAEGNTMPGTRPQDLEHTLRYYDDDVDGQNEYPPDSDSCFWSTEAFVALVDSHVRFAQETLANLDVKPNGPTLDSATAAIPFPLIVELVPGPSPEGLLRPVSRGAHQSINAAQGRKPWNATGEREKTSGKWVIDLAKSKPVVVKNRKVKRAKGPVSPRGYRSLCTEQQPLPRSNPDLTDWDIEAT
jgi:hypothetical protein